MTRTEDRLTNALQTAARSVREPALRPLEVPAPAQRRWSGWLTPAAAAACVALVVVVVTVTVPRTGHAPSGQGAAAAAGPPRFYAAIGTNQQIEVRATATGAVTGTVPEPRIDSGGHPTVMDASAVTAVGSGDREFIAAYSAQDLWMILHAPTRLYSFRLTSEGHVTDVSLIRGGKLDGYGVYDLSTSPDGSELAVSACRSRPGTTCLGGVIAVDLRTGAHNVWMGGLLRGHENASAVTVGWVPGGESMTFLASWCTFNNTECAPGKVPQPQLRELSLSTGGGSLAHSSVLFTGSASYPYLWRARLSADGRSIILMDLYGPVRREAVQDVRVIQVPVAGGQPRVLYHGLEASYEFGSMKSNAPGGYLLLIGNVAAWVHDGKLHLLPGKIMQTDAAW
jgi:hypothetical protein